jgi:5'-3' exoribonuclease 2
MFTLICFLPQFKPLEQLMGVFPAASRSHVPEPWGTLMYDPVSIVILMDDEQLFLDIVR